MDWRQDHRRLLRLRRLAHRNAPDQSDDILQDTMAIREDPGDLLEKCIVCLEGYESDSLVEFSCGDIYCKTCIENTFKMALKDETAYPPRCCYHIITLKEVKHILPKAIAQEFQSREVELKTKNKTYCHKPQCSAFIAPHSIHNNEAICQKCNARTCSKCKGKGHFGPCTGGEHAEFMEFASSNKWKRCPSCRRMVEKEDGCNHMLCRCGAEFCYGCGHKRCECTFSDDEDIDILDEDNDSEIDEESSAESEDHERPIVLHHRERHQRYRRVSEKGTEFQCESCNRSFYNWISRCERCEINLCQFCRELAG